MKLCKLHTLHHSTNTNSGWTILLNAGRQFHSQISDSDNTETHICAIFMIIELLGNESELVKVDKGMKWNSS